MELNSSNLTKTLKSVGVLRPLDDIVDQFNISLNQLRKFNDYFQINDDKQTATIQHISRNQLDKTCLETAKVLNLLSSNEYFHLMFYSNTVIS
jgi:hypothetical protein